MGIENEADPSGNVFGRFLQILAIVENESQERRLDQRLDHLRHGFGVEVGIEVAALPRTLEQNANAVADIRIDMSSHRPAATDRLGDDFAPHLPVVPVYEGQAGPCQCCGRRDCIVVPVRSVGRLVGKVLGDQCEAQVSLGGKVVVQGLVRHFGLGGDVPHVRVAVTFGVDAPGSDGEDVGTHTALLPFTKRGHVVLPSQESSGTIARAPRTHNTVPTASRRNGHVVVKAAVAALTGLVVATTAPAAEGPAEITGRSLVEGALDLTRGVSSYTELTMTIHRPTWEREIAISAWTRGREDALIRFTAPPKSAGVATLKRGDRMWTYAPRIGREFSLPSSMMSQQWEGSDFSYNDLSRTDKYLRHYDVSIAHTEERDGHTIHTLELIPHDDAPVVWGKETLVLRDDYVILAQTFYDQGLEPLKRMRTLEIGELGGRIIPVAMRMSPVGEDDRWTEIRYLRADFDADVEDGMFTTFALRGGR